jgi:hypothetical protein
MILDPKKAAFEIIDTSKHPFNFSRVMVDIFKLNDDKNYDIVGIDHPEFKSKFGMEQECVFSSNPGNGLETEEDVKNWLISIGMTEEKS